MFEVYGYLGSAPTDFRVLYSGACLGLIMVLGLGFTVSVFTCIFSGPGFSYLSLVCKVFKVQHLAWG